MEECEEEMGREIGKGMKVTSRDNTLRIPKEYGFEKFPQRVDEHGPVVCVCVQRVLALGLQHAEPHAGGAEHGDVVERDCVARFRGGALKPSSVLAFIEQSPRHAGLWASSTQDVGGLHRIEHCEEVVARAVRVRGCTQVEIRNAFGSCWMLWQAFGLWQVAPA